MGVALTVATGGLGTPIAMAIGGAASGAIISGYDAYSSGKRGWALAGAIGKGAGLGAITGLAGGSVMGAGSGIATSVTQNIGNQTVRHVAKAGIEAGIETAIDTGLDVATGNQITGQTVAMNFAYNLVSNGAGSVSPKKAPKAEVNTTKPTTGEVLGADYVHQRPVKDVTSNSSQKSLLHPMENANYAQKTYRNQFSDAGIDKYSNLAGEPISTVDDLSRAIQNNKISPTDIPIDYINRDGNILILNTRTSQALTQANVPRNQWNIIDKTGDSLQQELLNGQLARNKLSSKGTPIVRKSRG